MGQYYHPLLWKGEKGKDDLEYRTFSPWEYENGAKLTEHSWMGNHFVNAVLLECLNTPQHLVWVGDYSDGYEHDIVWGNPNFGDDDLLLAPSTLGVFDRGDNEKFGDKGWYLDGYMLNHTKKLYISFARIMSDPKIKDKDGWVLNPVPILCANSNGKGGGDYYGNDKWQAGLWAGDLLEYVEELDGSCSDYTGYNPKFKE